MSNIDESIVEDAALSWFKDLGYAIAHGPHMAPGEPAAERNTFADVVLAVLDDYSPSASDLRDELKNCSGSILWLHNKADLRPRASGVVQIDHFILSARTSLGLDSLRARLRELAGGEGGGSFSARARHLEALSQAALCLDRASACLDSNQAELAAEELRQAQLALGEITGVMDADTLLGRIFSGFCIGK